MGIKAGDLRHQVIIQSRNAGGRDEDGFEIPSEWTEYAKVWAKITPVSSRDLIESKASGTEITARMVVRHRTDITTDMRVLYREKVYAIASSGLDDDQSGLVYTTFNLSSGVEQFKDG